MEIKKMSLKQAENKTKLYAFFLGGAQNKKNKQTNLKPDFKFKILTPVSFMTF